MRISEPGFGFENFQQPSRPPASQNPHLNDWTESNSNLHAIDPSHVSWREWLHIWRRLLTPYVVVGLAWGAFEILRGLL